MIGWGWMVLAGAAVSNGGFLGAGLGFLVGSLAILVIGFVYAELASALPYAGGEHVYTEHAFGPITSFICTWSIIFGYVSVVAFEAIALPVALTYLFPELRAVPLWTIAGYEVHLSEVLIGAVAAAAITVLNILGIRLAARVQTAALVFIFAAGALLIAGGVLNLNQSPPDLAAWKGWAGAFSVIIIVPFLFVGFDVIPQSAEELNIDRKEIGRALIISIAFAIAFYLLIVFSVGLSPVDPADATLLTADAAGAYWNGAWASSFLVVAGIGGILTSWNAFLIGGSRAMFALARSGQLPAPLAAIHSKFATPWVAIAAIGTISVFAPLLGRNSLVWIVNAGGFCIVLAYVFVVLAFLRLRAREPGLERPFKAPGGRALGIFALILSLALLALYLPISPSGLKWPHEWGLVVGWFAIGAVFFFAAPIRQGKSGD